VFRKSPEKVHLTGIRKDGKEMTGGNTPLVDGSSGIFVQDNYAEITQKGNYQFIWSDGKRSVVEANQIPADQVLAGHWKVLFMERPTLGEPVDIVMDSLKSWTDFSQRSIRYFSGTARYSQSFSFQGSQLKNGRVYLDLGNVQEMAIIRVNGKEVSKCWISPYRADVSQYLRTGENLLEIDVTNLWANRLIGDGKLSKGERRTQTNIVKFDAPDAEQYLRVAGLLGPVKLQFSQLYPYK
jgi:hypothetical protein